jgi:hypothetical protein
LPNARGRNGYRPVATDLFTRRVFNAPTADGGKRGAAAAIFSRSLKYGVTLVTREQFRELVATVRKFAATADALALTFEIYARVENNPATQAAYSRLHRVLHDSKLSMDQWVADAPKLGVAS